MNKIYVTGDKHGGFSEVLWQIQSGRIKENDALIVLGDAGRIDSPLFKGNFIVEEAFPNLLYMIDGETYLLRNQDGGLSSALVIGGAYSVDKFYRLEMQKLGYPDYKWFPDEQLSEEEMQTIYGRVKGQHYDYVLTHTCPYDLRPVDMFLSSIDQSTVDESMEKFLQTVYDAITFDRWYLGHWHTDRTVNRFRFMYHDFAKLGLYY